MSKLKDWLVNSTAKEQKELVTLAGTSRSYLQHLSTGFRTASAEMAGKIEEATKQLRKSSKGRLPKMTRADLCPTCAKCPYVKRNCK